MPNLIKKIQNIIFGNNLFDREAKIILAVSGGPDSVCMLDVFSKLQKKYQLEIIVAHVNYNLRGRESEKDEAFVKKLAEGYNFRLEILNFKKSKVEKISENYLRNVRYDFFEKMRKNNGLDCISVAHNRDDQVETFFMRLIRGAGLKGLSAMQFKNCGVIRPLLSTSRKEIIEYLKKNDLKWREDKTNLENDFFRNKVRNKLIPFIRKNFNAKIDETILSNLNSISDDYDYISQISQKIFNKVGEISVGELKKNHPAIVKRILLKMIEEKKGDLKNIESSNIKEIMKILNSTKGKSQIIKFKGLKIIRKNDKLIIEKVKK